MMTYFVAGPLVIITRQTVVVLSKVQEPWSLPHPPWTILPRVRLYRSSGQYVLCILFDKSKSERCHMTGGGWQRKRLDGRKHFRGGYFSMKKGHNFCKWTDYGTGTDNRTPLFTKSREPVPNRNLYVYGIKSKNPTRTFIWEKLRTWTEPK